MPLAATPNPHSYEPIDTLLSTHHRRSNSIRSLFPSRSQSNLFAPGSLFSSVVNVCSATLGVGALALPFALSEAGSITGFIAVVLAAWASVYSIRLLLLLVDQTGADSFETLGQIAYGWYGKLVTQLTMLIFCWGGAIGCIIVVGDILRPVILVAFPSATWIHSRTVIQLLLVACVMLPISFYEHISDLRIMSLIACVGVLALALIMTSMSIDGVLVGEAALSEMQWVKLDRGIFIAIPIILFGFICQTNIFSIYAELQDHSTAKMREAVDISVSLTTVVYLLIGFGGYVLFGEGVEGNVLQNLDIREPMSAIAQSCVGLAIILTFPLNIYPARFTLLTMLNDDHVPPTHLQSVLLTLGLVISAVWVAIYVPSISQLFSFLGATTGSLIAFILPALFFLKLVPADETTTMNRTICYLMAAGGILLASVTTFQSLHLFIHAYRHPEDVK